ncbi:MAG: hemerythrin family protein [Betaproteobacteria bacterium]|nr:hemerythrin family protein [Betaproteobacteria bacterium]
MEWKEEFSVGIPEIDKQHRVLIDCISDLEQAVGTQQRWSAVHSTIGRLTQYTQVHFAVEESLMQIHGYPDLAPHAAEHQRFASRLEALHEESLRVEISAHMIAFLQDWLQHHVMTGDKDYASFFPGVVVVKAALDPSAAIGNKPKKRSAGARQD